MKKILFVLLSVVTTFACFSCGSDDEVNPSSGFVSGDKSAAFGFAVYRNNSAWEETGIYLTKDQARMEAIRNDEYIDELQEPFGELRFKTPKGTVGVPTGSFTPLEVEACNHGSSWQGRNFSEHNTKVEISKNGEIYTIKVVNLFLGDGSPATYTYIGKIIPDRK